MLIHLILEGYLEEPVAEKFLAYCGHKEGIVRGLQGFGAYSNKSRAVSSSCYRQRGCFGHTDFMDARTSCPPHALDKYVLQHVANPPKTFLCRFAVARIGKLADG